MAEDLGARVRCIVDGTSRQRRTGVFSLPMVAVTLLAAGSVDALRSPAIAADAEIQEIFAAFDDNGDQKIDRGEYGFNKIKVFGLRDADDDDHLSFEETMVTREEFVAADLDKDGRISAFEWIEAPFTKFHRVDANSDGTVSLPELERFADAAFRTQSQ